MSNDTNIDKRYMRDITKFARRLAAINLLLWNATCMAEEIAYHPVVREVAFSPDDHKEFLDKVGRAYKRLKRRDDGFAILGLNFSYFHDFKNCIEKLQRVMGKLDEPIRKRG